MRRGGIDSREDETEYLARFPNHDTAFEVEEVPPDIAPDEFDRRFVQPHRPCVVRGAARAWPAVRTWSADLLRERVGSTEVGAANAGVIYEPIVEYGLDRLLTPPNVMRFDRFLDELDGDRNERVQLYAELATNMSSLVDDLGQIDIVDVDRRPPRIYGDRFFISRRGYTDWHVHFADETLTTQICGRKKFLLLPPDDATFRTIFPMSRRGVWKTPEPCWPDEFARLRPWKVELDPGDVVYIPMHWWHAAESLGPDLNVTFARVFGTPMRWLADVRLRNVRFSLAAALAITLAESARARRPRRVRQLGGLLGSTAVGFPEARRVNGRRPGDPRRWLASGASPIH